MRREIDGPELSSWRCRTKFRTEKRNESARKTWARFSPQRVKIRESLPGKVKITWFQGVKKWASRQAMFLYFNALRGGS
jgi:hypothetical protein